MDRMYGRCAFRGSWLNQRQAANVLWIVFVLLPWGTLNTRRPKPSKVLVKTIVFKVPCPAFQGPREAVDVFMLPITAQWNGLPCHLVKTETSAPVVEVPEPNNPTHPTNPADACWSLSSEFQLPDSPENYSNKSITCTSVIQGNLTLLVL